MKSMQANSSLLKLKLDMVYRDLTMEVAQPKFTELTTLAPPKIEVPEPPPAAPEQGPVEAVVAAITAAVAPKAKRKKLVTTK